MYEIETDINSSMQKERMAPAKKRTTRKAKKESWDKIGASIGKKLEEESKKDHCCKPNISHHAGSGCIYGLGFIGALIYYISTATSFWSGLLGVLKAFLWPGFLVYALLKFLGA